MKNGIKTVVVIDDDPLVQEVMAGALSQIDVLVVSASTIAEALRWLDATPNPSTESLIFLVDVMMPEGDGFEFIRALADRGCRSPVIVMTGGGEFYLQLAHSFGTAFHVNIIDLMAKPIDYRRLLSHIDSPQQTRVLVVDDDPLSLDIAIAIFTQAGFDVSSANCGADALQRLETRATIDLLVTDIEMPGMNGIELAIEARRLHPGLEVLMVSASSDDVGSPLPFLRKPYQPSELVRLVRTMIDTTEKAPPKTATRSF
jgi:CheY-like chemotaxis protein